ncbi:MAG: hypothetical protein V3V13_05860 [Paracoccaceae bacterium]
MPEDCETSQRYRHSERIGNVKKHAFVGKKPNLAPPHRKSDAQILTELTDKLDADILARNSRQPPQCPECDYLGETTISDTTFPRIVTLIWAEQFQLRDANGNTITGTAKYMATGQASVRSKVLERHCDKPFGDDQSDFYKTAYNPEEPEGIFTPNYDLDDIWMYMSEEDKKGLKFTKKK